MLMAEGMRPVSASSAGSRTSVGNGWLVLAGWPVREVGWGVCFEGLGSRKNGSWLVGSCTYEDAVIGWALDHFFDLFRNILASFEGELDRGGLVHSCRVWNVLLDWSAIVLGSRGCIEALGTGVLRSVVPRTAVNQLPVRPGEVKTLLWLHIYEAPVVMPWRSGYRKGSKIVSRTVCKLTSYLGPARLHYFTSYESHKRNSLSLEGLRAP